VHSKKFKSFGVETCALQNGVHEVKFWSANSLTLFYRNLSFFLFQEQLEFKIYPCGMNQNSWMEKGFFVHL
jgi:hypothetical protein